MEIGDQIITDVWPA